jgi:Golgi nucleoside diphosphatase
MYTTSKNHRKTKLYQTSKTPYNTPHVISKQNSYEFVTILKDACYIKKSEKNKLVSNVQNTLQHLACAFTIKKHTILL